MAWIYVVSAVAVILFCPLVVRVSALYVGGKLHFGIWLFPRITLVRGYVSISTKGVNLCTKTDCVRVIKFDKLFKAARSFGSPKGFNVIALCCRFCFGGGGVEQLVEGNAVNLTVTTAFNVISTLKPFIRLGNCVEVMCGEECRRACVTADIVFNLFVALRIVAVKIAEVIYNYVKTKQNRHHNNQHAQKSKQPD